MRVIRAIIFILICIGLLWLGIILITRAFGGGGDKEKAPTTTTQLADLADTDAVVSMYIDGPIIANQTHTAMRFTIDRTTANVQRITGYDDNVVAQQTFPNTQASFSEFLSALDSLGFTTGNNDPSAQDPSGACPFYNRYTYTVTEGGSDKYRFWTTSCGGGTYGGQRTNTKLLFTRQIPQDDLLVISKNFSM